MGAMTVQQRGQAAQTLAGQGRLADALAMVEAAPASDREALLPLRINLLKAVQRPEDVVTIRRQQVSQAPQSVVNQHNLASALGDAGRHDEAVTHARKALSLGGKAPETWIVLARSLQALKQLDAALEAYGEVMARRSDYVEAISEQAQLIWMMGQGAEAARQPLLNAVQQHPTNPRLLQALGQFNAYVGMEPQAVVKDLVAQRDKGGVRDAALDIAIANLALDYDPDLALTYAQSATQIASHEVSAWSMLAKCQLVLGRVEEASDILGQLMAVASHDQVVVALHATAMRLSEGLVGRKPGFGPDDGQSLIRAATIDTPEGWDSLPEYLADLKRALEAQHAFDDHPIGQSLRHGTQTPVDLRYVDDPAIRAFFRAIDGPIRAYLKALGTGDDPVRRRNTGDYRVIGSWSVRLRSGGFHESHIHPMGWLSSACYIDLPGAVERGGTEGWIGFGVPPFELKTPLDPLKVEKPEPGKLVLFPSSMWHGTLPFDDEQHRLTIAFDLIPV